MQDNNAGGPELQVPLNEMSPSFKAPDETLGDRLIASTMFIDLAVATIEKFPDYQEGEDVDVDFTLKYLKRLKVDLLSRLRKYPAGSMQVLGKVEMDGD